MLARLFSSQRFYLHVRLNEDTSPGRWGKEKPAGLTVFAISSFIQEQLPFESVLLYDPYPFGTVQPESLTQPVFRIGVIGRLSVNKGIHQLTGLLNCPGVKKNGYSFLLFGEPDEELQKDGALLKLEQFPNVRLMGFCEDKASIYGSIDCVLHLCATEPLGRIFPEAIDHELPLVGFNAGGIGEIGKLTGLTDLLVDPCETNTADALLDKIERVRHDPDLYKAAVRTAKDKAKKIFNLVNYCTKLDAYLHGNTGPLTS